MSSIPRIIFFIVTLIFIGFSTVQAEIIVANELAEIDREQDSILEMLATEEKRQQESKAREMERIESEKKLLSAKVELDMLKSEREKLLHLQAKKDKSNQIKVAKLQKQKEDDEKKKREKRQLEEKKQEEKNIAIKVALKQEEKIQEKKEQETLAKKVENSPKSKSITAHINLSSQQMKVFRGDELLYKWRVSTARKGFVTPTGSYSPYYLQQMHYSKKYHNSPMPYSVFFRGGYAIHGTNAVGRLGSRASHGCVRLHTDNAKKLYTLILKHGKQNTSIEINN